MKILEILVKENFDFGDDAEVKGFSAPKISVSDLNTLQLRTLNRLKNGVVDLDSASDKELEIIMDLIDLGLVDVDGNVTDDTDDTDDTDVTDTGTKASEKPESNVQFGGEDEEELDLSSIEDDDFEDYGNDDIDFNIGMNRNTNRWL